MNIRFAKPILLSALAALPLFVGVVTPASAETTQCTAITKTPTVISRPGHYCLKKDLRFTPLEGTAIDVRAGNVVLDMNGYYLRGDVSTDNDAVGITVRNKPNVRISNGVLTHFGKGLFAVASSGLLVENMNVLNAKEAGVMFERTKASIIRDSRFLNNLVDAENGVRTPLFFRATEGTRVLNNDISNSGFSDADAIKSIEGRGGLIIDNNRITNTANSAIVVFGNESGLIQRNIVANGSRGFFLLATDVVYRDNTLLNLTGRAFTGSSINAGGNVVYPDPDD